MSRVLRTFVHEIGHGLGLGHTGKYNGGTVNFPKKVKFKNDTRSISVMSYLDSTSENADLLIRNGHSARRDAGNVNPHVVLDGSGTRYSLTPQVADIRAISRHYWKTNHGVKRAFPGNTVYGNNTKITYEDSYIFKKWRSY